MAYFSGLYDIVSQQCTALQIRSLLRKYKGISDVTRKEIRLSGRYDDLLDTLRLAVGHKHIPLGEVCDLIRKSEENGHQHIFLYQPINREVRQRCEDGAQLAELLFGDHWGPQVFPKFDRPQDAEDWADFRTPLEGTARGWLGKIYGHERVSRLASREKRQTPRGYVETLRYQYEDYSTVSVVRFRHGLLEIRIDQTGAVRSHIIPERLKRIWSMLDHVIKRADFSPHSLRGALTRMMVERITNSALYRLGSVKMLDCKRGAIQFDPYDTDEEIDADQGRQTALNGLLAHDGKGTHAAIQWKACSGAPKELDDLLTVVTGEDSNELFITAKTTAEVIDHVLDRFRHFSGKVA